MMGVFSSKEECEFNVRNFVDTLESDFSIEMVKTNKTDDRGETITYSGGKPTDFYLKRMVVWSVRKVLLKSVIIRIYVVYLQEVKVGRL